MPQGKPEVSDKTGALLVYSCFITYKSFSHRPTSIEHTELLGMWMRVNPEYMFFKTFRGKLFAMVIKDTQNMRQRLESPPGEDSKSYPTCSIWTWNKR